MITDTGRIGLEVPRDRQGNFDPIKRAFAKLKAMLRKAAERTFDDLWRSVGRIIDTLTPTECVNYLAAARYDAD